MYKRTMLSAVLVAATMGMNAQKPMKAPIGGKAISDELIGIFFEDISSSADGGLYAELLQNGSFEYSPVEKDGWGPGTAWKMIRPGHSTGWIEPRMDNPVHANNATYMRLHTERAKQYYDYTGWTGFGIQNDGFSGISVKAGEKYNFSVFMRNVSGDAKNVRIVLVEPQPGWPPKDPKLLAETTIRVSNKDWTKYEAVFTSTADSKKAALQMLVLTPGDMDVDVVSLIPEDTYKGHGLRKDLAQALVDLQPKFMRFPGGCVVHGGGDGFWNTYRWKTTIGPKEQRRQIKNTWGYHQSVGLGYFEYFQFCEDAGMEPLPILPCGVSCQGANGGWGMKNQAQDVVPMSEMDEWVDEAIDLIEWANGDPATNKWAKMRADAGHPKPFNLKYLGLGNEERISPEFAERFKYIYDRVTKAHPEIVIVGTAGPGSHPGNPDLENGWKLADETAMPVIDEHYYEPRDYFLSSRQYDYYPRDRKTKVYLGEYAAKDKKLIDALAEGLYLLHVERNGDVVSMTSYAPLFAKKNATNWNPDLIYFDNERPFLTCSYYVQQMFGQSAGQYYYGDCVNIENPDVAPRWKGLPEGQESGFLQGQSVVLNAKTRKLYVKLVNASDKAKEAKVNLSRFGLKKAAVKTVLAGQPNDENNYDAQPIAPKKETIKAQKKFNLTLEPYSMVMFEYSL
ncbi:alpha-L-arabinofuranosidase C-terminal domain-containing protein [Xylanibacter ruminicola]|uniref:non-reducing end alpha-L-arabinofuranosidase n=1 Tax=Xylanibacter ruminicola TaxID=839 RepID=A0A1M6SZQ0_XYLRU|nr:alpha-L-arabinofuranosidase C-terminal domain-containing protein [Xylanibacter ruminicola]SHK50171.1 Alpha-L-arabinofuranosidase [Xylanibacter ruminicola]